MIAANAATSGSGAITYTDDVITIATVDHARTPPPQKPSDVKDNTEDFLPQNCENCNAVIPPTKDVIANYHYVRVVLEKAIDTLETLSNSEIDQLESKIDTMMDAIGYMNGTPPETPPNTPEPLLPADGGPALLQPEGWKSLDEVMMEETADAAVDEEIRMASLPAAKASLPVVCCELQSQSAVAVSFNSAILKYCMHHVSSRNNCHKIPVYDAIQKRVYPLLHTIFFFLKYHCFDMVLY